ncbi:mannose-6-phosphate isomerase [Candidatus Epulonipiscium fishelsonii]|uniref:Mannose-6-phosphate isomerase n=1 Tax=Candidatus Epulonipiscium fishelsonii TaxID=77094 RepID=A0ACC8XA71_9FIRM|nr:mannose-6-phosphate isomerase [Epulopiscium sp. SCG-B11WGA-EpuloA1]ONI41150.1 mannose-6-phosphate isomerase [Epulopiscium sp. SCG-B05WGA-EpuloA1]
MIELIPAFKDYLWGGNKLRTQYKKDSTLEIVAESWELSTHPDGESIVKNTGQTLLEYIKEQGHQALGSKCKIDDIPILIKLIDAKQSLSIQVHPDDQYAKAIENDFGKTEMWYILEAEKGAQLVYGFNKDLSKEEFENNIKNNTLTDVMNYVPVNPGDVFFIEAGTLHAIGEGIVIAEIQQRSNVTYRVYDFGRKDANGNTRELHIDKSLDVTKLNKATHEKVEYNWQNIKGGKFALLVDCPYFNTIIIDINDAITRDVASESFEAIMALDDELIISDSKTKINLSKGDTIFVPANSGEYKIEGRGRILVTHL